MVRLEEVTEQPAEVCAHPRRVSSSALSLFRTSWFAGVVSQVVPLGKGILGCLERPDPNVPFALLQGRHSLFIGDRDVKRKPLSENNLLEENAYRVR